MLPIFAAVHQKRPLTSSRWGRVEKPQSDHWLVNSSWNLLQKNLNSAHSSCLEACSEQPVLAAGKSRRTSQETHFYKLPPDLLNRHLVSYWTISFFKLPLLRISVCWPLTFQGHQERNNRLPTANMTWIHSFNLKIRKNLFGVWTLHTSDEDKRGQAKTFPLSAAHSFALHSCHFRASWKLWLIMIHKLYPLAHSKNYRNTRAENLNLICIHISHVQ